MAARQQLKVLFFDVFGTCVSQNPSVADELSKATREALESDSSSMSDEVRSKAEKMVCLTNISIGSTLIPRQTYDNWFELAREWNREEGKFVSESKEKQGNVDWRAVDKHRIEVLPRLLADRGLIILGDDASIQDGSIWNNSQLDHLGRIWHRLPPWPDTNQGLDLLNTKFSTVALSNTYNDLLQSLVAHSNIPFTHLYSSDMFHSFKPNPKVYLGAAEQMGVKPEECALVAAHLNDLKGAKACGFYTVYVERPLEEKNLELVEEKIPDMVVGEGGGGFVGLAERLEIRGD